MVVAAESAQVVGPMVGRVADVVDVGTGGVASGVRVVVAGEV